MVGMRIEKQSTRSWDILIVVPSCILDIMEEICFFFKLKYAGVGVVILEYDSLAINFRCNNLPYFNICGSYYQPCGVP